MKLDRQLSKATSLVALSTVVAFSTALTREALAQATPKLESSVVLAMPGGPIQDALQKCMVDDFTKKTNVRVDILSIAVPQAIAKVIVQKASPTIDVLWGTDAAEHTGFKEGVVIPITRELVPNIASIEPQFVSAPNRGAVISMQLQGIQYNTAVFKEKGWAPPKSWRDLWDPKYKGKVGIHSLQGGSGQALVAIAAFLNGGNPKDFGAAFEYLVKMKPNLYAIFSQPPQVDQALVNGDIWLGISSAGRPLALMQEGNPVSFAQPDEGVVANKISLQLVKGSPSPKAAAALVNWMLSKEAQSCLPAGYIPVVKGVPVAADMVPYMTVQKPIIPVDAAEMQDRLPELLARWNKEMETK